MDESAAGRILLCTSTFMLECLPRDHVRRRRPVLFAKVDVRQSIDLSVVRQSVGMVQLCRNPFAFVVGRRGGRCKAALLTDGDVLTPTGFAWQASVQTCVGIAACSTGSALKEQMPKRMGLELDRTGFGTTYRVNTIAFELTPSTGLAVANVLHVSCISLVRLSC